MVQRTSSHRLETGLGRVRALHPPRPAMLPSLPAPGSRACGRWAGRRSAGWRRTVTMQQAWKRAERRDFETPPYHRDADRRARCDGVLDGRAHGCRGASLNDLRDHDAALTVAERRRQRRGWCRYLRRGHGCGCGTARIFRDRESPSASDGRRVGRRRARSPAEGPSPDRYAWAHPPHPGTGVDQM